MGLMAPADTPSLARVLRPSGAAWARAGSLAAALAGILGFACLPGGVTAPDWPAWLLAGVLVWLSAIDIEHGLLPDVITLPLIVAGLVRALLGEGPGMLAAGLGALVGYLLVRALDAAWLSLRGRAGIGQGDAKLLAAAGAWCGVLALPLVLLVASTSALALVLVTALRTGVRTPGDEAIAFGPFLGLGMVFALVVPKPVFLLL